MNAPRINGRFAPKAPEPAPLGDSAVPPAESPPTGIVSDPVGEVNDPPAASPPIPIPAAPRRRGRPPGAGSKPRVLNPSPPGHVASVHSPSDTAAIDKQRGAMAAMLVQTVTGGCEQVFGQEWKPAEVESSMLIAATDAYLKAKNIPDLPPGVLLLMAIAGYALPRFAMPETKAKIEKMMGKKKPETIIPKTE